MGKNDCCTTEGYADGIVEPKISKYLRYFVLFVLFLSIALILWNIFTGLEDGVTIDDLLQENIYFFFFIGMTLVYMALPGLFRKKWDLLLTTD